MPAESDTPSRNTGISAVINQTAFLLYSGSRFSSGIAQIMHQTTLVWQVYELTQSPLSLAGIGGVRFVAQFIGSLYGGALADTADRGRVVMLAQIVPIFLTSLLIFLTITHQVSLPIILGMVLILGVANAFENPARQAMLPSLIRRDTFQSAIALSSSIQQLAFTLGFSIGGVAISMAGVQGAYAITVALTVVSALLILPIKPLYPSTNSGRGVDLSLVKEGFTYVLRRQPVFGAMLLDTVAVIFAMAQALVVIFAKDVLAVGPEGFGILNAAQGVGTFLMSLVLLVLPRVQRAGRMLVLTVAMYGLATILFALSSNFYLSVFALALTGAFDQVSMVMRQIIVQMGTPDALRGRVSAVNYVFINAANQLGTVHMTSVTQLTGSAPLALAYGGVGCIVGMTMVALRLPGLWRHDARIDAAERERESAVLEAAEAAAAATPAGAR